MCRDIADGEGVLFPDSVTAFGKQLTILKREVELELGVRLQEERRRKDATPTLARTSRKLGAESGVSYVTVQRIEAGKMSPTLDTLEKLAKALGIGVRDLL
jgi:DNA-binding Xre family transcriptional regulator